MLPSMLLQFELALIGFVFSLLTFVVQTALVIWTYSDATDNSSHSAILWALVVLFAPLLGVVLYLLLGRDQR
ncbi:PLDc N-terminal domain-containing protein [Halonotius sp. GCM10025705]|uniref:PLDc N-terminal domain-containing protein n=1 Tax=Halonotius sp. GCM10025705 TaxID=3252678 RepID=UPI00361E3FB3